MPIRKVSGGYQWGEHGKVYADRPDAVKQAVAAFANGYRENQNAEKNTKRSAQRTALDNLRKRYSQ